MAKLKAPLLSLGAQGAIGKSLVFFGWKGIDAVREYVVPSNPKTTAQTTQRGYLSDAVDDIHDAQADATKPLVQADVSAYALLGATRPSARTWFNEACKNFVDCEVAGKVGTTFRGGDTTPGAGQLAVEVYSDEIDSTNITAATFKYGTSKSALINSQVAVLTPASYKADATLSGLTAGVKYYWRLDVDVGENCEGATSGIYYGTPT